ncbi:hypothetical protein CYMTET_28550 [Cymbomonas tetramitiformis]|uniref:Xaa-Pro dipeptidyl-peptidase C-terminal domain-containing protein n=1 Tax=Cymbomonas tetramitiformis TaxID=36881 RepID=A0AAE0FMP3_9CHLO|nr:hypothetical protein CYMTET_28550 [Cymbomonas tetramitiformis]
MNFSALMCKVLDSHASCEEAVFGGGLGDELKAILDAILVGDAALAKSFTIASFRDRHPEDVGLYSVTPLSIPSDGADLAALRFQPAKLASPPMAIIFVGSWASKRYMYMAQAAAFARKGYAVLCYSPRGIGNSTGVNDVAGPEDMADFTRAVNLLTPRHPHLRVAAVGISYGSAIALRAAAVDARVSAVVALSAMANLTDAFFGQRTPRLGALSILYQMATIRHDQPPSILLHAIDNLTCVGHNGTNEPAVTIESVGQNSLPWLRERSPSSHLSALNRHRVPVFVAHGLEDYLLHPNQIIEYALGLEGPKYVHLLPGWHTTPSLRGLYPNLHTKHVDHDDVLWSDVQHFIDRHLRGNLSNLSSAESRVLPGFKYHQMNADGTSLARTQPELASSCSRAFRLPLAVWDPSASATSLPSGCDLLAGQCSLAPRFPSSRQLLHSFNDTIPDVQGRYTPMIRSGQQCAARTKPMIDIIGDMLGLLIDSNQTTQRVSPMELNFADLSEGDCLVLMSGRLEETVELCGIPSVVFEVMASSRNQFQLVVYLYDVEASGSRGTLITHGAWTSKPGLRGNGEHHLVEMKLNFASYTLQKDQRVAMVIDSTDPYYMPPPAEPYWFGLSSKCANSSSVCWLQLCTADVST